MSRRVVQVVPNLPPPPEGVGSFAMTLAEALRARHGIESRFLAAVKIPNAEPAALRGALEEAAGGDGAQATVLLHYANYGYEPRGCPSWLVDGLTEWKGRSRGRLVTVFHEVHAMGLPWRSSFWLSPLQRRLAASLARLSDGLATSMGYYRRILLQWVPGKEIALMPVFSTVGEPAESTPLAARARRMVVFGGPGTRAQAYRELRPAIESSCRMLGIEEVCDVGPGDGPGASDLPVRVRRLGPLPAAEVSELLAGSLAGFIAYPAPFLPKSTIFAAYSAHRVLPVCAWPRPRRQVEPPPPFWTPRQGGEVHWDQLQDLTDRAHAWYGGHSLARHAVSYRDMLFP
ncbi:MAG TPA: glycosyltransferase family 1 protein [Thermoanaerobaculia bacterium]|nr:glycosyltransferase family 1 protein [Thermoanaerobaculia bacterium]